MPSRHQRAADDVWYRDDELAQNLAAEDEMTVVNDDDDLEDTDNEHQLRAVAADNDDYDGGLMASEPGATTGRTAASSDGQFLTTT